jgi:serine/threonine-protein kinase
MADAPIQPGDLLAAKYRVDEVLGAGAMGVVVAATDLALDRKVAIKMMKPESSVQRQKEGRFLREARVVAKLRSEHVAKVHDFGTFREAPFIVMEYLEGRDLAAVLGERGPLPVEEAVTFTLQACEAIAEAHAAGIVHRDIKPANLFVTKGTDGSPKIKVVDFGIAKHDASGLALTSPEEILGSPLYMSPESMRGIKDVDVRTDVWALACCLFEMMAGVSPFARDTIEALMAAVFHFPAPSLAQYRPDVPPGLDQAIQRALEKKVELRTPSVTALAADIAPYASPQVAGIATSARSAEVAPTQPLAPPTARAEPPRGPRSASSTSQRRVSRATTVLIMLATAIAVALVVDLLRDRAGPTGTTAPTGAPAASTTIPPAAVDHAPAVTVSASPTSPTTAEATAAMPPTSRGKPPAVTAPPAVPGDGSPAPWKARRR